MRSRCPCCGKFPRDWAWAVVSAEVNRKIFGRGAYLEQVFECAGCGCAWACRGWGRVGAARLHAGAQLEGARSFEPWLWRAADDPLRSQDALDRSRLDMAWALSQARRAAGPRPIGPCVEHGGEGSMLRDLRGRPKWAWAPGGSRVAPWAKVLGALGEARGRCALAVQAMVLQRVDDPLGCLLEAKRLLAPGGWLYVEAPWQRTRLRVRRDNAARQAWLEWVLARPARLAAMGALSRWGWAPCFLEVGEDLNFFTLASLKALAKRAGFYILCSAASSGRLALVLAKPRSSKSARVGGRAQKDPPATTTPRPRWRAGELAPAVAVFWC